MIKKMFSVLLIVFGSFLEIYYYAFRFQSDGIALWLAVLIGVALTLFLCVAVIKKSKPLVICLIVYSVLATSAGQHFSLEEVEATETKSDIQEEYRQEEIDEIKYRITQIDEKYKQIQEGIDATAKTLHDRGMYRTALSKAEAEQERLNAEREGLRASLSKLRSQAVSYDEIKIQRTTIYHFYYSLLGLLPVRWLQFLFQTVLSVFIALMAPLSITLLIEKKKKAKRRQRQTKASSPSPPHVILPTPQTTKKKKPRISDEQIHRWVRVSWMGIRTQKSSSIVPYESFMTFTQSTEGPKFTTEEYHIIKNAAQKQKCIDIDRIIVFNEKEVEKRIKKELT